MGVTLVIRPAASGAVLRVAFQAAQVVLEEPKAHPAARKAVLVLAPRVDPTVLRDLERRRGDLELLRVLQDPILPTIGL
jgi:hypothetical protein